MIIDFCETILSWHAEIIKQLWLIIYYKRTDEKETKDKCSNNTIISLYNRAYKITT